MNILICSILLFSLLIIFLFYICNNQNTNINDTINLNNIQEISSLLSYCKNVPSFKNITIVTRKDLDKYLNYLSCSCKGIGYWGGFCLQKEKKDVGFNWLYDVKLGNALGKLFINKRVVDLGAGLGWYCPIVSNYSKVCDEYDGSVNIEEATNGRVKYLNLAEPINIECNYDYAMSMLLNIYQKNLKMFT